MTLRDIGIKPEYRSLMDNIASDFIVPALQESIQYDRAVGFFSSTALVEISKGLGAFVANGGKMRLIASPHLSEHDIVAIDQGYKKREEVISAALIAELREPRNYEEKDRLNLLANLVASGILEIRIAFTEKSGGIGIYHEKVGILTDKLGNVVAFSGSMNESKTALLDNYETVDVFCSWSDRERRTDMKKAGFEAIWNDTEPNVRTFSFPDLDKEVIRRYKKWEPNFQIDPVASNSIVESPGDILSSINHPKIPSTLSLRKYQKEAIASWEDSGFRGIFDMATGTGKTKTALGALVRLSETLNNRIAVIIVCPFQHLVEQWTDEISQFNIDPIVAYSDSPQKNWYDKLKKAIRDQRFGVENSEFLCVVCTNGTFRTQRMQEQLRKIRDRKLLIVDEAHNFGADYLRSLLDDSYDYRLALSATIERHGDSSGTDALFSFFGERCITYSLEEAIHGRGDEPPRLTPYKYYPVVVSLEEDELENYTELSREIGRCIIQKGGKKALSERGKRLALARARIVAGAREKIRVLSEKIYPYKDDNYILVYCGATKMVDSDDLDDSGIAEDKRQIEVVNRILGNNLKMMIHQFTSQESRKEREEIKRQFANGQGYQALVAIKCLDEGVDIPSIKTAFILASTTNPREYIQRRGRLLRQSEGKEFAEIYDFVTLPRDIEKMISLTREETVGDRRLVYNELVRAKEFARLSLNAATASKELTKIEEYYFGINGIEGFANEEDYSE